MNYIHIIGRLGRDAEERVTADGQKILTLTMASDSRKSGKDETIWYRVTFWGDRYAKMVPYLKKGKPMMVGGELFKPTMYDDRNGNKQISSVEVRADYIKFLPYGKTDEASSQSPGGFSQTENPGVVQGSASAPAAQAADPFSDEALPF